MTGKAHLVRADCIDNHNRPAPLQSLLLIIHKLERSLFSG